MVHVSKLSLMELMKRTAPGTECGFFEHVAAMFMDNQSFLCNNILKNRYLRILRGWCSAFFLLKIICFLCDSLKTVTYEYL